MSVVITLKFQGDVATFRQALTDHGDQFAKMAEQAKGQAAASITASRPATASPRPSPRRTNTEGNDHER